MAALTAEAVDLWRARALLLLMVQREVRARHAGSVVGAGWMYAQPLLTIAAYYLVFDIVFQLRLGEGAPTRAVGAYLIAGLLPWMAFCDATSRGMHSLLEAGGLLQKNPLPPVLFPARAVLVSTVTYLPLLLLLLIAYAPLHRFAPPLLALPILIVLMIVLFLLLAYILAILAAALRDTAQLATFALSIGVFVSPVLFPTELFPAAFRWLLWLNPMTPPVLGFQALLLAGEPPPVQVWAALLAWIALAALALDRLVARSREQLVDWL